MKNVLLSRKKIQKAIRRVYPRFGLRKTDVILSSFPKSGNTWIRFIWANIISINELNGRQVDYNLLNGAMLAEYESISFGNLRFKSLPRLVKTHNLYDDKIFGKNKSIYIYRNPGDVMVSYFEYFKGLRNISKSKLKFSDFIRDDTLGIVAWCKHKKSWEQYASVSISYENMKNNPNECIEKIMINTGLINALSSIIPEAIKRSEFRKIREIEETKGMDFKYKKLFKNNFKFTRKGEVDQWKEYFNTDDRNYLISTLKRYDLNYINLTF